MSVLRPRTRVVYFRVSEDEFRRFHDLCQLRGERSLSDLARSAMYQMLQNNGKSEEQEMAQKIKELDATIAELNRELRKFLPAGKAAARKASTVKDEGGQRQ